ncbi:MAG: hypothetical protein WBW33_19305 [Bryobacteraceae bacterium]
MCDLRRCSSSQWCCPIALLAEVVKALIVANHFLETELKKLRAAVSPGYARLPRDRKDWYD